MIKFVFKNKSLLIAILIISFLTLFQIAFEFLIPTFMGYIIQIVNSPSRQSLLNDILLYSLFILLSSFASIIVNLINSWIASRASTNALAKVRSNLHKKVLSLSLNEINNFGVESLVTRTTEDIRIVGSITTVLLHDLFHGPLLVLGALSFLIIEGCHYQLVLVIVIAVVVLITSIMIGAIFVLPRFRIIEQQMDDINNISKEKLDGLRTIRAYNAEMYQETKFRKTNHKFTMNNRFVNRVLGMLTPVLQLITGAVTLSITLIGAILIKDSQGDLRYDQIAVIIQFGSLLLSGFITIIIVIAMIPQTSICIKRINEVLETEMKLSNSNNDIEDNNSPVSIKFDNITFTYPGSTVPVLKNITFTVKKGETIAFIGSTGSGKTTIVNLLLHFFEPQKGNILINNQNINEVSLNSLYEKISWVPQKSFLFHDSIKNNVCLGKPNATNAELKTALIASQSFEFVNRMKGKINSTISRGGKNVSGGQSQRLCIARALICNPEILVLDDSFSSLDYLTVKKIYSAIDTNYKNITKVIVSQRVSAIMRADNIIVLENGRIIGQGKHRELFKTCKTYYNFATSQVGSVELLS
ncbi:MAG: ABC transporter ATP-binding protein/permease [Bacilli bacterium]|nr:ABC transporter ATP-binding protein/permease [Bacilli bacterium]